MIIVDTAIFQTRVFPMLHHKMVLLPQNNFHETPSDTDLIRRETAMVKRMSEPSRDGELQEVFACGGPQERDYETLMEAAAGLNVFLEIYPGGKKVNGVLQTARFRACTRGSRRQDATTAECRRPCLLPYQCGTMRSGVLGAHAFFEAMKHGKI